MKGAPSTYGLGFLLGPRVNAGGRIGAADLGARLLATDDPHEAAALAARLHGLNAERREIEAAVRAQAEAQAGARAEGPLVWAAGEGWHPGVVGIVAARLKESFGRPAVVIGFAGDEGKGSGRSVTGVDLGAAVARLAREGLIARGGGHRMAAGVSLTRGQLEPAMARLGELLAEPGRRRAAGEQPQARRAGRARRRDAGARRAHRRRRALRRRVAGAAAGARRGAARRACGGSATAIWRWRSPTGWAAGSTPWRSAPSRARSGPSCSSAPAAPRTSPAGSSATTGTAARG